MRIAIIVFPGSNCERETALAVKRAGMIPVEILWNEAEDKLIDCQGYVLIGGFSYEDRGRAGVIAAHLPILEAIKQQSYLGKPVLGICNGAQILVESGLIPGIPGQRIALTNNKRMQGNKILGTGYYNAWVNIKSPTQSRANAFNRVVNKNSPLKLPIAHAEGRFLIPEPLLSQIKEQGLIAFQYCNDQGDVIDEFPVNPNGSVDNIAGLCNPAGNVLALMPHPERTTNADSLFESMREYISGASFVNESISSPTSTSRPHVGYRKANWIKNPKSKELIIQLIITDNHAWTMEQTLHHLGIPVRITRQIHWQIECDSDITLQQIKTSGILYNDKKERLMEVHSTPDKRSFLVQAKEDHVSQQKMQMLMHHAGIDGVSSIKRSILWHIEAEPALLDSLVDRIMCTPLLFNPISHECYYYG